MKVFSILSEFSFFFVFFLSPHRPSLPTPALSPSSLPPSPLSVVFTKQGVIIKEQGIRDSS